MKWFREGMTLDDVFTKVREADLAVLMTDYDGTLAPFVYDRDRAKPYIGLLPILGEIARIDDSQLVVISGRTIEDLRKLFAVEAPVEMWGTHGWERWDIAGEHTIWPIEEAMQDGIDQVVRWAREDRLETHLEVKPASVAIHWRGAEARHRDRVQQRSADFMTPIAESSGLVLHNFDGGRELRAPGRNKGAAVRTVLDDLKRLNAFVCYMGDDLTDEDAFDAVGENGLRVLVRDHERESHADMWIRPPRELRRFLERWRDALLAR